MIEMQEKHHVPSSKLLILLAQKLAEVDNEMERLRQIQAVLSRLHTHELKLLGIEPPDPVRHGQGTSRTGATPHIVKQPAANRQAVSFILCQRAIGLFREHGGPFCSSRASSSPGEPE